MKSGIHPNYQTVKVTCSCGATFTVGSTAQQDVSVEICSQCHPFFTGQQKLLDTGRLDRYQKRMAAFEAMQKQQAKKKGGDKEDPAKEDKEKSNEDVLKAAKKAAK